MSENIWGKYYERTKDLPPRPTLVKAVELVKDKNEALDLGPGALTDVKYLLSIGFNHVTAVDNNPVSREAIDNFPEEKVSYVANLFENFEFPENKYDLINAQYSLPFNPPATFNRVISKAIGALKKMECLLDNFLVKMMNGQPMKNQ